jgi:hypothetical protein
MPLLSEDRLAAEAEKRETYRLVGVTTKLSPREVAEVAVLYRRDHPQCGIPKSGFPRFPIFV